MFFKISNIFTLTLGYISGNCVYHLIMWFPVVIMFPGWSSVWNTSCCISYICDEVTIALIIVCAEKIKIPQFVFHLDTPKSTELQSFKCQRHLVVTETLPFGLIF